MRYEALALVSWPDHSYPRCRRRAANTYAYASLPLRRTKHLKHRCM